MANVIIMAIWAITCSKEYGLRYGQLICLLQQNQNYNELVKTETKSINFKEVMPKNRFSQF